MSYQLLSSSRPRARKAHDCIWCREKILAGEQHFHHIGKFYGEFQDSRYHAECFVAAEKYFRTGESEFDPHSFKRGSLEEA